MTDLPLEEIERINAAWSERVRSDALSENGQDFRAGWVASREYSKQREEKLQEALGSDEAFRAAEGVLTGIYGEPSPEEEHTDTYGAIISAVLAALGNEISAREMAEKVEREGLGNASLHRLGDRRPGA